MGRVRERCGKPCEWIFIYAMLFVGVSAFLNKLSMAETLLVLVYQIFIYAVPGMAVILLLGLKVHTDVEWIGYTFVAGYCCNIILYYAVAPFGLIPYMRVAGCLLAALSMVIIYKKREQLVCSEDKSGMKICSIGVLCYALIMFVAYNANGLTPNLTGATDYYTYHRDVLYWIGNLNSLIKQYPPIDPREYAYGIYNYHYFSSIQLAVEALFTGVSTVVTCIGLYFYATIPMIVFGAYLVAKKYIEGRIIVWAICALLITSGAENITNVAQVCHYVLSTFGTDYGLGILLFLMLALYRYCEDARKLQGIICVALLTVLTGTKGPYAAIALFGFGGTCLALLLQKKVLRSFLFGGTSLASFGITYYFVCNVKGYMRSDSQKLINIVIRTDPNMSMLDACLRKLSREILNVLLMKPVVLLPLIVVLIIFIFQKKRLTVFEFACLCMTVAGLGVNAAITMPTNQEIYFALAALVPAWCLLLDAGKRMNIPEMIEHTDSKWIKGALAGLLLLGVVCFVRGYTYNGSQSNIIDSVTDGIKMIGSRMTGKEIKEERQKYLENGYTLGREDYEELLLIAQDYDQKTVILHILPEEKEGCRSYRRKLLGCFSTKYITKDEMAVDKLKENSKEEYQRLYDMGIRYIILDLWGNQEITMSDEFTEKIYVGEQMKIYRIRAEINEKAI